MKRILSLIGLMVWTTFLFAQDQTVKGKITSNADGSAIPGVNVSVKGTTNGTITNIDGDYSLSVPSGATLVVSFIGMKTIESPVTGGTADFKLIDEMSDLDEVVVVGYGVKKKSLLTGATSSVSAADMSSSVTRAEQAMQGKAPGISVTSNSGSPGNGMKVRIRGAGSNGKSDPLYIVDGMKTGDINYLNPSDIESMEVLKDAASSAIYGTEGANGVVIIKTKTGSKGEAQINYTGQYGIQSLGHTTKMMNAGQYSTYMKEVNNWYVDPDTKVGSWKGLTNVPSYSGKGTNWIDEISETAPMQAHTLSFSGGGDKGNYLVSTGYSKQDGVIGGSKASFERFTARMNVTQEVKSWLEVGANASYANSKRSALSEDDGFHGVVNSALQMDPTTMPTYATPTTYMQGLITAGNVLTRDDNGNYYGLSDNNFVNGEIYSPLIRIHNTKGLTTDDKIVANEYVKFKPFEGFSITSRAGMDLAFQNFHNWNPSYYGTSDSNSKGAAVTLNDQKWSTWLWENFASYNKKIGDHDFTILGGVSAQEYTYTNLNTSTGTMLKENDHFAYPDFVSNPTKGIVGGKKEIQTMSSTFGRFSYDFRKKYLFEATVRRDGSSLFGSENKYGIFPSVSGGWVLSEESFWKVEALNFAKVRLSWGQNGSTSNLGVDQYSSLITTNGIDYPNSSGVLLPGAEPDLLANSDLKWETSEQTDFGIDLRALDGMIYFTFDAYKKVTNDLLTLSTPAISTGNDAPYWNAGEVTNSGLEFLLGVQNNKSALTYDVNVNMSFMKNEVTGMNSNVTRIEGASAPTLGAISFMELGQPIYYFRGYKVEGIQVADVVDPSDPTNPAKYKARGGDVIIKDINGDGVRDEKDQTNIGSPQPDFILGTNINLAYKGFDLNVFAQGVFGQEVFMGFMRSDRVTVNKMSSLTDDRWTPTHTTASMPRAGYNNVMFYKSDLMVQDGSYVKIRQIQLGYTLPKKMASYAKLNKARVYVSLNDYFTFTKYDGMDPEVGSGNNNAQGIDYGTYPVAKKVLFGVALTF